MSRAIKFNLRMIKALDYKHLRIGDSDTTYGLNGNIIRQSFVEGLADPTQYLYLYDDMDRLEDVDTLALGNAYNLETFTYDDNGNRLTYIQNGTSTTNYAYTAGTNQLASTSGASVSAYTYDANGNLLTDTTKGATFHYDLFNQLDSIEVDHSRGHNYVTFGYNTAGERVWKEHQYWHTIPCDTVIIEEPPWEPLGLVGTQSLTGPPGGDPICWDTSIRGTYYVRSGGKVLAEYTSLTSAPKFKFIYAGDQRIAMIDDQGDVHFYLNDHLGSARRVIAENGLMQESYTYWAFGASRQESIAKNQAYRYTGKPFDDNESLNLYYYGARHYDTDGRFTAIDPLARMYPGWSPYAYTLNNPLKYVDPDGNSPTLVTAGLGAVAGALVGGGIETIRQVVSGEKINTDKILGAGVRGGIAGGVAGATGGVSLLVSIGSNGAAGVVGGMVERSINGETVLNSDAVVTDLFAGAAGGAAATLVQPVAGEASRSVTSVATQRLVGQNGKNIVSAARAGGKAVVNFISGTDGKTENKKPSGGSQTETLPELPNWE